MLNFTVGPVQSGESIRKIGYQQVPYFRTAEFSEIMFENERLIKKFSHAGAQDRVVFITGSGTASMEAAVINCLSESDKALIVNGGGFGQRFVDMCALHHIPFDEIKLEAGKTLTAEELYKYDGGGYTAFIVNIHETSTGVLYPIDIISGFCKKNNLFLIVDAISSFLADAICFEKQGIDVMITGSQKALSCPPGISLLVLSARAQERIEKQETQVMYLDLKSALLNAERGQTPFTPAVSVLLQIHQRLTEIDINGSVEKELERIADLAQDFRSRITELPFSIFSNSLSNAVTPLYSPDTNAYDIFLTLKDEYNIWVCPNGGDLADKVFRVGHIGYLTKEDNTVLINALLDMQQRGLI